MIKHIQESCKRERSTGMAVAKLITDTATRLLRLSCTMLDSQLDVATWLKEESLGFSSIANVDQKGGVGSYLRRVTTPSGDAIAIGIRPHGQSTTIFMNARPVVGGIDVSFGDVTRRLQLGLDAWDPPKQAQSEEDLRQLLQKGFEELAADPSLSSRIALGRFRQVVFATDPLPQSERPKEPIGFFRPPNAE